MVAPLVDNVGCDNYGGVGGYSTSGIAWSGATIQIQIDSEDDGGVWWWCRWRLYGGYGDPNGTNNLTIVANKLCKQIMEFIILNELIVLRMVLPMITEQDGIINGGGMQEV
ncbi:MAG: hypothetical protein R2807_06540 [Chitinophagales bacterium]